MDLQTCNTATFGELYDTLDKYISYMAHIIVYCTYFLHGNIKKGSVSKKALFPGMGKNQFL